MEQYVLGVSVENLSKQVNSGELHIGCHGEIYHIYVNGDWTYTGNWLQDRHDIFNDGVIRKNTKISLNN
ncbi:hypothetical protein [Litchfieldia alkalitelluris]|nr:hypothetical protein [Litchfieldia alkalitelluris]